VCAPVEQIAHEQAAPTARGFRRRNLAHLPLRAAIGLSPEEVKASSTAYTRIGEERSFEIDAVDPQRVKR